MHVLDWWFSQRQRGNLTLLFPVGKKLWTSSQAFVLEYKTLNQVLVVHPERCSYHSKNKEQKVSNSHFWGIASLSESEVGAEIMRKGDGITGKWCNFILQTWTTHWTTVFDFWGLQQNTRAVDFSVFELVMNLDTKIYAFKQVIFLLYIHFKIKKSKWFKTF